MRVNPDQSSNLLAALNRVTSDQNTVLKQMASGKKIDVPSDDPAGAAALIELERQDSATQQYLQNAQSVSSQMQAADSALSSAEEVLQKAIGLGVEAATATTSDDDRQAIANQLSGMTDQLLDLANTSLQGVFLFAGTASKTKPYVADNSNASGIAYQGNDDVNQVQVGEGYWIPANQPGTAVFGDGTSGVFAAMEALISAVQSGSGIDDATDQVSSARAQLSSARVTYGNAVNQANSGQQILNSLHIQLAQQETNIGGVDMADAATRLANSSLSRQALLSTISQTSQESLFNYLSTK